MPGSVGLWLVPSNSKKGERTMYHRIVISSFAAVAIGMSCIATDASARGGGGGFGGGGGGRSGGTALGVRSSTTGPTAGGGYFAASGVRAMPSITGVRSAVGGGGRFAHRIAGVGGPTGDGGVAGARYYSPASYDSNAACGRYPYPPCNRVPAR
jgi:hypothetical protein